jgi:tetratricopeptide (TPR) repeat protein
VTLRFVAVFAALTSALLMLAACGGKPADPGPPPDNRLEQANRAGTQALSMDQPDLAMRQYQIALQRAYERDDSGAIADISYNLALAQLKAGDAKAALATVKGTRIDLERRHAAVPAELYLVQAAAAYRSGDPSAADTAAQEALSHPANDPSTVPRAWFIRGLVAAQRSDGAGLAQAIAALPPAPKQPDLQADREELLGRTAMLDGRPAEALSSFEQSATSRQQALDYRGMARALSLAGEAALRTGRTADAADLYFRAGRSALLQGDDATARTALKQAEDLARQTNQPAIIEEIGRVRKLAQERASAKSPS